MFTTPINILRSIPHRSVWGHVVVHRKTLVAAIDRAIRRERESTLQFRVVPVNGGFAVVMRRYVPMGEGVATVETRYLGLDGGWHQVVNSQRTFQTQCAAECALGKALAKEEEV